VKISKHAEALPQFLVGTATPATPSSTHHIPKAPNYEHPHD